MEDIEELRRALVNCNLIPFVGAGVSIGAAGLPSWPGLLRQGIRYLEKNSKALNVTKKQIKPLVSLEASGDLLEAFNLLQKLLGGAPGSEHYQSFLTEVFDAPAVTEQRTLDALRRLGTRVMVTTNYDLLLKKWCMAEGGEVATWLDPQQILAMLRARKGVIHLHGRYDLPESIILSSDDYTRVVNRPQESIRVAHALFDSGVLLFVGCSLESVHDPHLKTLLDEFRRLQDPLLEKAAPHFMLVKSDVTPGEKTKLRRLGIKTVVYGKEFADLAAFINSIPPKKPNAVQTEVMSAHLYTLRHAKSITEVLAGAKDFIEEVIFPGRKVRVAFAEKMEEDGRTVLRTVDPLPPQSTRNSFSYPQTLAAWAMIEGRIFGFPHDLDLRCDFARLRQLRKHKAVTSMLLATSAAADPVAADYLNLDAVRENTGNETLTLRDIYQHWVGRQSKPHYSQFVSVPVPVVDFISNQDEYPERCVINIDTPGLDEPLLTDETRPLLKLVSDMIALGYELIERD